MRKILILLFLIPLLAYSQTDYRKLTDNMRHITSTPYIHDSGDTLLWQIVEQGTGIVPTLIDKLTDTRKTKAPVLYFGGVYTVADMAYLALNEIIKGIPTFELLGVPFSDDCGYCSYWYHLRESKKNRKAFQQAVGAWYEENKDKLVWVKSTFALTGDCFVPLFVGGHYEIKESQDSISEPNAIILRTDQVDSIPLFVGGIVELTKYLTENLKLSENQRKNPYKSTIHMGFVVDANGVLHDIHTANARFQADSTDGFDSTSKEIIRVFESMSPWQPAIKDGKPVSTIMVLFFRIRI